MPAALHERKMAGILNGLGEGADRFREQVGEVGHLDPLGNFRFGPFGCVQNRLFPFDQWPLERFFGSVHIDRLAVLPGRVEQESPDVGRHVGLVDLDMARLDREGVVRFLRQPLIDGARAEAGDIFGPLANQPQHGADHVSRVVHRDHPFPILGPTFHVLWVAGLQVLDFSKFTLVEQPFDKQIFAAVDDCFRHHVLQARLFHQVDNLPALVDRRCHRYRAEHVFAGPQGGDRHGGMIGNGRIDMDEVDFRIGQYVVVAGVPFVDTQGIANLVQMALGSLADGNRTGQGMLLVDGDELGPEAQADHGHIELYIFQGPIPSWGVRAGDVPS